MNTKKFISNPNYKGKNTCGEAAGNWFLKYTITFL